MYVVLGVHRSRSAASYKAPVSTPYRANMVPYTLVVRKVLKTGSVLSNAANFG